VNQIYWSADKNITFVIESDQTISDRIVMYAIDVNTNSIAFEKEDVKNKTTANFPHVKTAIEGSGFICPTST